jgi:DNA-binding transcriptional MerR regulator
MGLMTIAEFVERTRLSPKALQLYDWLGLLRPERVDPDSGYRFYSQDQVGTAQLTAGRRALVSDIRAKLTGAHMATYNVQTRTMPERMLATLSHHLHANETDAFFADAFTRLRSVGPSVTGIEGCPFLIFCGEVSEDSDGPMELCRPVTTQAAPDSAQATAGIQVRAEPAHNEAFIRLAMKDTGWPTMLLTVDALEAWIRGQWREPAGPLPQVLIADQRTAPLTRWSVTSVSR